MAGPSRIVHCSDAIDWLNSQPVLHGCSFITSLPDITELQGHMQQLSLAAYKAWVISTAQLVLNRCPDNGLAIFFQTDIKVEGSWLDKAYLIQRAAEETGHALVWHKIVCRVAAGTATYSRPAYHHMLCFSKGVRTTAAAATADVLPSAGDTTWARGMGTVACTAACKFVLQHTATRTVIDPFCGHGTVLAVANQLGLNAVGVEISAKRAKQAEHLSVAGLQLTKGSGSQRKGRHQQQGLKQEQDAKRMLDSSSFSSSKAAASRLTEAQGQQRQRQQHQKQQQSPGSNASEDAAPVVELATV